MNMSLRQSTTSFVIDRRAQTAERHDRSLVKDELKNLNEYTQRKLKKKDFMEKMQHTKKLIFKEKMEIK